MQDDAALLSAIAEGDQRAFAVLVSRHAARVFAVARRFARTDDDADDLSQRVFWKLWQRADRWQPGSGAFSSWLYRITVNECIDWNRREKFRRWVPFGEVSNRPDERADAPSSMAMREDIRRVQAMIPALPPKQRAALILSVQQELTNLQIAEVLETTEGAVEQLLVRARKRLRAAVGG